MRLGGLFPYSRRSLFDHDHPTRMNCAPPLSLVPAPLLAYLPSSFLNPSPPEPRSPGPRSQALSALVEVLACAPLEDNDSVFRALVALGTICHEQPEMCSIARDMGVQVRELLLHKQMLL